MARDRKRAKRRASRSSRPASPPGSPRRDDEDTLEPPKPLEHAVADIDLLNAQLEANRPSSDEAVELEPDVDPTDEVDEDHLDDEEFAELEDEVDEAEEQFEDATDEPHGRRHHRRSRHADGDADGAEPPARRADHAPAKPKPEGNRVINFLRGSWRELQRVQWPDRRQVAQGTGVVLGFVIVSGAFLALMDFLSQKIVNAIL